MRCSFFGLDVIVSDTEVARMSNTERLKFLAEKCEQLASLARDENIRERHLDLAASYRRLAEREQFLEKHPLSPRADGSYNRGESQNASQTPRAQKPAFTS